MTDAMRAPRGMVENPAGPVGQREAIGVAAERLLEKQPRGLTGAACGGTSAERLARRDGSRHRVPLRRRRPVRRADADIGRAGRGRTAGDGPDREQRPAAGVIAASGRRPGAA